MGPYFNALPCTCHAYLGSGMMFHIWTPVHQQDFVPTTLGIRPSVTMLFGLVLLVSPSQTPFLTDTKRCLFSIASPRGSGRLVGVSKSHLEGPGRCFMLHGSLIVLARKTMMTLPVLQLALAQICFERQAAFLFCLTHHSPWLQMSQDRLHRPLTWRLRVVAASSISRTTSQASLKESCLLKPTAASSRSRPSTSVLSGVRIRGSSPP